MLKIVLDLKGKELKTLETDMTEITIGRNENSDIRINNLGVSKKHARIVWQDDSYMIEDLNSTNGTFLNNKQITKAGLTGKDVITIGKYTLFITCHDGRSTTQENMEATIKITP